MQISPLSSIQVLRCEQNKGAKSELKRGKSELEQLQATINNVLPPH